MTSFGRSLAHRAKAPDVTDGRRAGSSCWRSWRTPTSFLAALLRVGNASSNIDRPGDRADITAAIDAARARGRGCRGG